MKRKLNLKSSVLTGLIVVASCVLITAIVYMYTLSVLKANVEESLTQMAVQGAANVQKTVEGNLSELEMLWMMSEVADPESTVEERLAFLSKKIKNGTFSRISIADPTGASTTNDGAHIYVGDREYFKKAMVGKKNVSDPLISRVDGRLVFIYAIPIYTQSKALGSQISGVLYATSDIENLCRITDDIRLGDNGYSFIIDREGNTIAHKDRSLVFNSDNNLKSGTYDSKRKSIVELEKRMIAGETGAGSYFYKGVEKFMGFAPVSGTEWFIAVTAPKSQIFKSLNNVLRMVTILALVMFLIFSTMGMYMKLLWRKLKKEKKVAKAAIDAGSVMIIDVDASGKILDFNQYAEDKTQYKKDEVCGSRFIVDLVRERYRHEAERMFKSLQSEEAFKSFEMPINSKNGTIIHVLWNVNIHRDSSDSYLHFEFFGMDITKRVEAERQLIASHEELTSLYQELSASKEELEQQFDELTINQEKLRKSEEAHSLVVEASNIGIWDWEIATNKIFFSPKWYEIMGINPESFNKQEQGAFYGSVYPDDLEKIMQLEKHNMEIKADYYEYEYRIIWKDGSIRWIHGTRKALWNSEGKLVRLAGSTTDITEKREYESKIHKLAYFDQLTGLSNRVQLSNKVNVLMNQGSNIAFLFIDIDNFKYINDTFGHSTGDRLLGEIGRRIVETAGAGCMVARLGGDEFAVLVEEIGSRSRIDALAESLMRALNIDFAIDGISLSVSASMGIAFSPEDAGSFEELLKNADIAMYRAKENGKRQYVVFDRSMNEVIVQKMRLESSLRSALDNNELLLYYQPQVNLSNGRITGFEALIRWNSPVHGFVPAYKIIEIAEETGIIVPIGKWVLHTACVFAKELQREGFGNLFISVNISAIQLLQDDFVDTVVSILHETGLPYEFLELEITETVLMESIDSNVRKLKQLKSMGIKVSLDDFGRGYSSLNYLRQLPITTLKIDKSFIDDITTEGAGKDLTEQIIILAHKLGLKVIAEGVETGEQLDYLSSHRCDMIQGYYISRPVPEIELLNLIEARNAGSADAAL